MSMTPIVINFVSDPLVGHLKPVCIASPARRRFHCVPLRHRDRDLQPVRGRAQRVEQEEGGREASQKEQRQDCKTEHTCFVFLLKMSSSF